MKYLLTLLVPVGITSAGDPAIGSPDDNACNAGGVMDGKCTTEWHWVCGWYLARWQSNGGWLTPNNPFNDACASLLPPRPVSEAAAFAATTTIICIRDGSNLLDLSYPSFSGVSGYVRVYFHTTIIGFEQTCIGPIFGGIGGPGFPAFYGTPAEAVIACPISQATTPMSFFLSTPSLPANLYFCS
jgi:hypothetical protein